jgi:hypothetical protein
VLLLCCAVRQGPQWGMQQPTKHLYQLLNLISAWYAPDRESKISVGCRSKAETFNRLIEGRHGTRALTG